MPDYDFRSLSPIDFEMLARDLLNADLNLKLVSFGVGPDGGIDLRDARVGIETIVQCKHRPDATKADLVRAAGTEANRWKPNDMRSYFFVTSSDVSPEAETAVLGALSPLPVSPDSVWHQGALNAALSRNSFVERDHFKLWLSSAQALERITAASQWQRSEQLLQRVSERVKLYVHTPAYAAAMKMLEDEHVVMLSGAPGVGKSTLAEMILLSLWHAGWTVVNIASDVDEAWRQIRTSQDKVVFYYDDFLGQTTTAELQKNEGSGVASLMDWIRRGSGNQVLVLTTREQVLRSARHGDDDRVRRLADDQSKIRIELDKIARISRAQMLFNHLHFGFRDEASRAVLASDNRYRQVIDHSGFNPRILESVVLGQKHSDVDSFYAALFEALDHPESIWTGSFRQLSTTAVKILFQLAVWPSAFMPIEKIREAVRPEDPREWLPALKVLENTWIRLIATSGVVDNASLFDPSRRDFLLDLLDDPVYFDAVLHSVSSLGQITYIWRLAGLIEDAVDKNQNDRSILLRNSAERREADLDSVACRLATLELDAANKSEAALSHRNKTPHPGSSPKTYRYYVTETLNERLQVLIELASICFGAETVTPEAQVLLQRELGHLEQKLKDRVTPDASDLFSLAAVLASERAPKWSHDRAADLGELAFDFINESEQINAYGTLPEWFRQGPFNKVGKEKLQEALEREIDGIGQHNDRDLMSQLLDEVDALADEYGVGVYTESLRERIEAMPPTVRQTSQFAEPARDNNAQAESSDAALEMLFAKLNI
jgi:hypothetical protein